MIVVIAKMSIKSDKVDEFRTLLETYTSACRQLPGVLSATSTQVTSESDTFLNIEEFENEEAFNNHGKSEVFHQFMGAIGLLIRDTEVNRYEVSQKSKMM